MDMLMDENMEKFSEKLKDLLALAKKKKNVQGNSYSSAQHAVRLAYLGGSVIFVIFNEKTG